jgi:cytidylate kinase
MTMPDLSHTLIINGLAGTGSSTVARLIAERTGYEYVYGGGIFRQMANEAGMSLEAYMASLTDDPEAEVAVDDRLATRALAGDVIIESRVLAWLLPEDCHPFAVWLTCDEDERVRRVGDRDDHEDAKQRIEQREAIDAARYQGLYGIDLDDHGIYDLVIDTTTIPAAAVADQVMAAFAARTQA